MSDATLPLPPRASHPARGQGEPAWLRWVLIALAVGFIGLLLVLPLVTVFYEALRFGLERYGASLLEPDALKAVGLTLTVVAIAVPLNTVFGVAAAWLLAKFQFPGRSLLIALIDLPLAVSPVIAGLVFVLLFGRQGVFGPLLETLDVKVIFALPGIALATTFVTFSFVARELLPVMQSLGREEEEAAVTLGARGWQVFRFVTLPNIKWGLLYGVIMCNARAMGEFGAVSVVSGKIRGLTTTVPLHIEMLYNEYNTVAAFAVASVLALLALVTLVAKSILERRTKLEARGGV
jgi:sulfate/thiosulfate transport system permease protein